MPAAEAAVSGVCGKLVRGSALACLLAALLLPQSTGAAPGGGFRVELSGNERAGHTGDAFAVQAMVPGQRASVVLHAHAPAHVDGELRVQFRDVHDDDNGCTPSEALVDRSCGAGGGELGRVLAFALSSADQRAGPYPASWTGTVADLENGIDIGLLRATSDRWIKITATLPVLAGDEVQSDGVVFRLLVELRSAHGVSGVTVGGGGNSPRPGSGTLAHTGFSTGLLVITGLLFLGAGALIARRPRHPRPAVAEVRRARWGS